MKRINKEANSYVIIYASVMIILVALALSFTHQVLAERQIANVNIDKIRQILRSLNMEVPASEAKEKFSQLIVNAYLVGEDGNKIEGSEGVGMDDPAFQTDIARDASGGLPVFEANIDGSIKYIIPMSGTGLWGPLWGYLAIESDGSTIFGSEFGHAGETPGLGAEIVLPVFRNQFIGKELFKNGVFKSVAVVKPGKSVPDRDYVDGISGGTITSQGVDAMVFDSVARYKNFLMNLNSAHQKGGN